MINRLVLMSILFAGVVAPVSAADQTSAPQAGAKDQAVSQPSSVQPSLQQKTDSVTGRTEESQEGSNASVANAAPESGQPPQVCVVAPSSSDIPEEARAYRQELLQEIADARRNLATARKNLSGTSQEPMMNLAGKLLDMAEARLLNKPGVLGSDEAQQEMASALKQAQQRLDALRQQAGKAADADGLRKRIDNAQLRLNQERQQLTTMLATSAPAATSQDQLMQLYAYAQQRLDAARARALTLPNSKEMLKRLDAAQQRLDEAKARFGTQPASQAN
ncbi:MAG: hypothetical protein WB783_18035 [Arenicellales bacterium]